jgi:hypothetical protein
MTNKNIIDTINTVCHTDLNNITVEPHEIFLTAFHCFYFMKPSDARVKFLNDLSFIFIDTRKQAEVLRSETQSTMMESLIHVAAQHLLPQLIENFDEAYFKAQTESLENDDMYTKELIVKYINKFDRNQLFDYIKLVGNQNFSSDLFISGEAFLDMWFELNEECCKIDPALESIKYDVLDESNEELVITFSKVNVDENGEVTYEDINTLYFFDCLSDETIKKTFVKHINGDIELLAFLTQAFCHADPETAMYTAYLISSYMNHYDINGLDTRKSGGWFDLSDEYLDFIDIMVNSHRES